LWAVTVRGLPANYPPPSTGLSIFLQVPALSAVNAIGNVAWLPSISARCLRKRLVLDSICDDDDRNA